ncbi:GTP-binding protein [bacterium]|nr:GTP-binding protein [bacterium]
MAQIINKKICLLGEYGAGKTSMIRRFVFDLFSDDYITTIGVKVTEKVLPPIERENKLQQFRFMIWDIAGSEEGKIKHENYWMGASGALIVTDLCRPKTFSCTSSLIEKFLALNNNPPIVIVGNKTDLIPLTELNSLETTLQEMAHTYRCPALLTSAKTGQQVEESFIRLAQCMME